MKIRTPQYYKDFKCIAGACTDTCCAGWDVDVDKDSYKYYKTVKGAFGKRLKSVMVPSEDGGCTFTLNNGRCPFLNEKNLCDLYTELGEDKLCETCAEFPRFINEYGNVREIGIAPSCKTAGELIFNFKDRLTFDMEDDGKPVASYNDIDGFLYMQLLRAREIAYDIVQDEDFTPDECCILLLDCACRIQKHMDKERDELIENVVYAFMEKDYRMRALDKVRRKFGAAACDGGAGNKKEAAIGESVLGSRQKICNSALKGGYAYISRYFDEFKGMEVINPDWYKYLDIQKEFINKCTADGGEEYYRQSYAEFDEYYKNREFEYRQLLMYYVYRYFLDAVYDYNLVLKVKNGIIGYIVLKHLDVAAWRHNNNELGKEEQIDIAHLYSRQFEHSYTNFEKYSEMFCSKRCYSINSLMKLLM